MITDRVHATENYHHGQALSMILLMTGYMWSNETLKAKENLQAFK